MRVIPKIFALALVLCSPSGLNTVAEDTVGGCSSSFILRIVHSAKPKDLSGSLLL